MSSTENAFISVPYMYREAPQNGVAFPDVVKKTYHIIACHCREKKPGHSADDITLMATCYHKVYSPLYTARDSTRLFLENQLNSLDPESSEKMRAILDCFKTEPCVYTAKSKKQFLQEHLKWTKALPMIEAREILLSRTVAEFLLLTQNKEVTPQYRQEYMNDCMPVLEAIKGVRPGIYDFAVQLRQGRIPEELVPPPFILRSENRLLPPGARYVSIQNGKTTSMQAHQLRLSGVNALA